MLAVSENQIFPITSMGPSLENILIIHINKMHLLRHILIRMLKYLTNDSSIYLFQALVNIEIPFNADSNQH